jgi:hypothetical protein
VPFNPPIAGLLALLIFCAAGSASGPAKTTGFYKEPPLFSTCPSETALLQSIDEFAPRKSTPKTTTGKKTTAKKTTKPGRFNLSGITFKDQGMTDDAFRIWSGDTLMDLSRYQALKMTFKTLGGSDYLFIEAGGFSEKNAEGWKSPRYVLKRAVSG